MSKDDVQLGDIIHIYHLFGKSTYRDTEGVVQYVDPNGYLYGTWGFDGVRFDDDWEIINPIEE